MFSISTNSKQSSALLAITILLSALTNNILLGQVKQMDRFEIPIKNDNLSRFSVASAGENGLIIKNRLIENKLDRLEITQIDTSMQEVWKGHLEITKELVEVNSSFRENTLFMLFKSTNYQYGHFHIAAVDLRNGLSEVFMAKNFIPFSPTEFIITDQAALIGGYFNYRPLILYFDFTTRQSKILPGFFNEPGELTQLKTLPDGSIEVIVSTDNFEKKRCLWMRTYDPSGNLVKTIILEPEDKKNLLFGRSIKIDGQDVVVGTYGRYKEYSRGIFTATVTPNGQYQIRYYSYGDLQHFFSYLKATREKRIKGRIERKKVKGKKAKFNYRFIVNEVIKTGDNYVMLGEAFYPQYVYVNGISIRSILIGYHYTHAVVIGFDGDGNLKWDNSFEINDVMTRELEQFVKIQAKDDKIILQYVFKNQIRTKIISGSEIIEGKTFDEIKLSVDGNEIRDSEYVSSRLDYWYDDRLFVYGIGHLRNFRDLKFRGNRSIFFVNKILYK